MTRKPSSPVKITLEADMPAQLLSDTALLPKEVIQTEPHEAIAYSRTRLGSRNGKGA